MACCKVCCGCQNCTEGQEGKCCCGGESGTCCSAGEYCCDGVCYEGGCIGACCNADCAGSYSVDFIPNSPASFTAFLEERGYGNVAYLEDDPTTGSAKWTFDCCVVDNADTEPFVVSDGSSEITFSVPLCLGFASGDCVDGLTQAQCAAVSGFWQGAGTECDGVDCPCDPPANSLKCEQCQESAVVSKCAEGQYCCDGACQDGPCGACCDADCASEYEVDFIPDSPEVFTEFLDGRGYGNVTYVEDAPEPGWATWTYECCLVDPDDTETYTVSDGVNEFTFTVPRCLTFPVDGCTDGLTNLECTSVSGEFVAGEVCEDLPCGGCQCQDGTTPNGSGGTIPATLCEVGEYVCVEFERVGAECAEGAGGPFIATVALQYAPCSASPRTGVRSFLCAGFSDAFDITGVPSCQTVVYDEECGCTASECDWTDIVGEWAGLGGSQCDCALSLLSYTMKLPGESCP